MKNMLTQLEQAKIAIDPYYSPLYEEMGLDYILAAGFFFDNTPAAFDVMTSMLIPCTPLLNISKPTTTKHCIIITSGAMCPPHDGHIEMMAAAKLRLEKEGYEVLGGYIAPDHDNYVFRKNAEYAVPAEERIFMTTKKIWQWEQQSWLSVDPWYGLFTPTDLNFTTLMHRTHEYLKKYLSLDTEVFYVCGGDRSAFSASFKHKGGCVVVARPGAEPPVSESNNVLIASLDNNMSSTELRNRLYYKFNRFTPASKLTLREDGTPPIPFFDNYFNSVSVSSLSNQKKALDGVDVSRVISLDPLIKGDNYLQVSRDFDLYGHYKSGYYLDDSNLELDESKSYLIFDDDVYTGGTLRYAANYLKTKNIEVSGFFTLSMFEDSGEIQDNRDFVLFQEYGGLVININGIRSRAPYVYPFVDPMMRSSIKDSMSFSIEVWKFNYELNKSSKKTLKDLPFKTIFEIIGFSKDTLLSEICNYYLTFLTSIAKKPL